MDKLQRVEVWFKNDLFKAFSDVKASTVERRDDGTISFRFGSGYKAIINMSGVDFIVIMDWDSDAKSHN